MTGISRRRFIRQTTLAAAATSVLPGVDVLRAANSWAQDAAGAADVDRLQRDLRDTAHDRVLAWVTQQLQRGVRAQDLWHATFLAGIHEVEPDPVGFDLPWELLARPPIQADFLP